MPQIGEVARAKEIDRAGRRLYHWRACEGCGKERWVLLTHGKLINLRCNSCKMRHFDGRKEEKDGYILIKLQPDDFFYKMVNSQSYVREHRLVVAKALGRCLHLWEIVHHKNHIRDDNRLENLQLISDDGHKQITLLANRINFLEGRVAVLEAENILLRGELWGKPNDTFG